MLADIDWSLGLVATILSLSVPIVGLVAYYWYQTATKLSQNELKREMIERGMNADEIERVLRAGTAAGEDD